MSSGFLFIYFFSFTFPDNGPHFLLNIASGDSLKPIVFHRGERFNCITPIFQFDVGNNIC